MSKILHFINLLIVLFANLCVADESQLHGQENDKITYILYARPDGIFGGQLKNFWNAVKKQNIKNPPVWDYPPHVTLTGFFPYDADNEDNLISALEKAIKMAPNIIPIKINNKITSTKGLDYIGINSTAVHSVASDFLKFANVDTNYIRPKTDDTLGYHISLRQKTDKATTSKVRNLEKSKINLAVTNLQTGTTWSLYIYKKTNKNLEVFNKQIITTY